MKKTLIILALALILTLKMASALVVNSDYITIYPGEQGKVDIKIENNENFDIQDISISLDFTNLPFTSVGSSEKNIDDINEDDDDSVSFTLKASTDIKPGDYSIPYTIKYTNVNTDENLKKEGNFGIRVSARTDLDFSVDVNQGPVVGQQGKISLEIINKGLGDIKSILVEVTPNGFELLSNDKVFIGTINADDTDSASFDVIYKNTNPILNARVTYKDFDNNDQVQEINLPFKVYTNEEALKLGIIKKDNTFLYIIVLVVIIVIWLVWRRIRKKRKNNKK